MSKIVKYKRKQKYKQFLDSCERQLRKSNTGIMHKRDLIVNARTKRGTKMRTGIPDVRGVHVHLLADGRGRFVWLGDGLVALADRGAVVD